MKSCIIIIRYYYYCYRTMYGWPVIAHVTYLFWWFPCHQLVFFLHVWIVFFFICCALSAGASWRFPARFWRWMSLKGRHHVWFLYFDTVENHWVAFAFLPLREGYEFILPAFACKSRKFFFILSWLTLSLLIKWVEEVALLGFRYYDKFSTWKSHIFVHHLM